MNPTASIPAPKPARRGLRWLVGLAVVAVLYPLLGFWVAPKVIRSQLLKRLPELTHRQASVGRVLVNPYTLSLTISNLSLGETDGRRFVGWTRLHGDLQVASLWRRTWVLRELSVSEPRLTLARWADGTLNFANLIPTNTAAEPRPLPPLVVEALRVTGGELVFEDEAIPGGFTKRAGPFELQLTNFSTLRQAVSSGRFSSGGDSGESLLWSGDLTITPPSSEGMLSVKALELPRRGPYLRLAAIAELTDGSVDLETRYRLSLSNDGLDVDLTNTVVGLTKLALTLPDKSAPMLTLGRFEVGEVSAGLRDRRLRVGKILVRDGEFRVDRSSDGSVNLAQAIRPEFVERALQVIEERLAGWQIDVVEVLGERLRLDWHDVQPAVPVQFMAETERLQVNGLSSRSNQVVTVSSLVRWGTNGMVSLAAEGTLRPPAASARLQFDQLSLPPFQPYVAEFLNLRLNRGEVSGQWNLTYNRNPGGPLITAEGGLAVKEFLAFDTQAGRDFLKWDALEFRKVQAAWEPAVIRFEEIHFENPATSLVLMTNGQFNVLALLRSPVAATNVQPSAPAPPPAATPAIQVSAGRLTLHNASLYAADRTIPGEFATTLERFSGSVTDLAWPDYKKSRVEFTGTVGLHAPFTVDGWVVPDPARLFLDMHVTTTNAELIPFTPYAIKFAGYPLREGRVTADVRYRVEGRQLEGQNHVIVDRLALGPKAGGTAILDLPFKLGIALLKDSHGRITLDVPVKGSLDDPEFGVGKVVWQAVKGLFVKVATAPFKLLGSLFGGSEDEGQALQQIQFEPGATNLPAAGTNQLERLVKALGQRPELLLAIRGGASPEIDGPPLARQKLDGALRQLRATELDAAGIASPGVRELPLSPAETARLLPQLFADRFPASRNEGSAPSPPPPEELEQQLLDQLKPSQGELDQLRAARVAVVTQHLLSGRQLPPDRLVRADSADTNSPPLLLPVVEFSLE